MISSLTSINRLRFAWKTFSKWQTRGGDSAEDKAKKHESYKFMQGFRDTFSIPVKRIRFLGLFDTVNSVPRFETAWMQRSKFPYTAKSSARVIRHAVSIDERRAKFRQDLISQKRPDAAKNRSRRRPHLHRHRQRDHEADTNGFPRSEAASHATQERGDHDHLELPGQHMGTSAATSSTSVNSINSQTVVLEKAAFAGEDNDFGGQSIEEVWFPGCHADIGESQIVEAFNLT